MKLSLALIAVAPAVVSAKRLKHSTEVPNKDIAATSKSGNRILSKARRLDGGGDEAVTTWVSGYSLKFHSCVANQNYYGGWFNGDNGGNDNNNGNYNYNGQYDANAYGDNYNYNGNNNGAEGYEGMYQQKLVHFKLCPSDSCWSCKGGADYVVELGDYVDAVLEAKMSATEYQCEQVREQCYCGNANSEQSCQYDCYKNAGLNDCAEAMYEDEFDLQEAVECVELEVDEDAAKQFYYNSRQRTQANGYYAQNGGGEDQEMGSVYVGPYCAANGKNIHLGLFMEETCSFPAPKGMYEALHYGENLPYSKKGIVDSGCISCKEPKEVDYNNYYDQQDADEVTDVCSTLYEAAGKCEENLGGYQPYRDNFGCNFIKNMQSPSILSMTNANVPAKVFAGIFAVTTVALAGVAAVLFKRNRRQNVSLAGDAIIS